MPQLIVNGDDLGFSPGTNKGILTAHLEGIVSSTTVMINLDYAESGLETMMEQAPTIGIGLHINLTHGKPVASPRKIPSLVEENGEFFSEARLAEAIFSFDEDELYEEIAAQIERFIAITGRRPTHLDSHYHIAFLHPLALRSTLALAAEYGNLPLRETAVNAPVEALVQGVKWFIPTAPDEMIRELIPQLKSIIEENGANMPARFETGFTGPNTTLGDLLNILVTLPEDRPTELLCHPGIKDDPLNSNAAARQKELDALIHPTAREVIERYNIELITYATLQES